MTTIKLCCFSGSTRTGSINQKLADFISLMAEDQGVDVTRLSLKDYALPLYDGDQESETGLPDNAQKLYDILAVQDAIFISSPEYNGSFSPLLKNTIDWVSRVKGNDWITHPVFALGAATPGMLGGLRGLFHVRDVLSGMGGLVTGHQVLVGNGFEAFQDDGSLIEGRSKDMAGALLRDLIRLARMRSA